MQSETSKTKTLEQLRALFQASPGFWEADYYDCCDSDSEPLTHNEPDDAIEEALDRWMEPKVSPLEHLATVVGETITVHGYKRKVIRERDLDTDWILEQALERLDEEYGNPDDATDPTPGMEAAAKLFADAIRAEYKVWTCDPCGQATVNVDAWVREMRPDWLEPR